MSGAGPRCFVAMAFGPKDTDALFARSIAPLIRKHGIPCVIINRKQSNHDLNLQIIDELKKADFCIADLTYARPSVYFEAGFAQRQVEVIYTVRHDHLDRHQPDDRRVHFDLQMKPLLTWTSPTDRRFLARLERRLLATVVQPWRRKARSADMETQAVEAFRAQPVNEKLAQARRLAIRALRKAGFRDWGVDGVPAVSVVGKDLRSRRFRDPSFLANGNTYFAATRRSGPIQQVATVVGLASLPMQLLRRLWSYLSYPADRFGPFDASGRAKKVVPSLVDEHHFLVLLHRFSRDSAMREFPYLTRASPSELVVEVAADERSVPATNHRHMHIHLLDEIRSPDDLRARLTHEVGNVQREWKDIRRR